MKRRYDDDSLCCCEYINRDGRRAHLLGCLCDCSAVDELAERCVTCRPVNSDLRARIYAVLIDRCRLPGLFGGGAFKISFDPWFPLILVPTCIYVGSWHPILTILGSLFSPAVMLFYHKMLNRQRSSAFFVWSLVSISCNALVYFGLVVIFRRILLWEHMIVFTLLVITLRLLVKIRRCRDMFIINHSKKPAEIFLDKNDYHLDNFDKNLCSKCRSIKSERSGHCSICQTCVPVRDHHCVWIDSCIGAENHRAFFSGLTLCILGGAYGLHLTLCSICTPEMYYDWWLLPSDCRFLYTDTIYALITCQCVHTASALTILCIAWLHQAILISQNVTQHELIRAGLLSKNNVRFGLFLTSNCHNRGFFKNWLLFWSNLRQ